MTKRDSSDEIDRAGAAWAARLDRGALTDAEKDALETWEAQDRRRAGALLRAQAVLIRFDRARALGPEGLGGLGEADRRPPPVPRRALLIGGLGAMAAAVTGFVWWNQQAAETFRTGRGETRTVVLPDGSSVTLDALSRIEVTFGTERRQIVLHAGRALFDVARDPARRFEVIAGPITLRALGTSFAVMRDEGRGAEAVVREGLVEIDVAGEPPVRMQAFEVARIRPGHATRPARDADAMERALAWRAGMLDFDGETLAGAAARFARYSDYRFELSPEVARERVTGRFAANDPRGFARATAESLGLRAEIDMTGARLRR